MTIQCILQTKNTNIVINRIRHDFAVRCEWFYEHCMVFSPDKSYYLALSFDNRSPDFSFNDTTIENINGEKSSGIVNDKLSLKFYLKNIYKKTNQKLGAFLRISKLTALNQLSILLQHFDMNVYLKEL